MLKYFLYKSGNFNEGNFARYIVCISPNIDPWDIFQKIILNEFYTRNQDWVKDNLLIDGDEEYGIYGVIYEGPKGEQSFGSAWLTHEFQPIKEDYLTNTNLHIEEFN